MADRDRLNVLQRLNIIRTKLSYVQKDQQKIDSQYTATRYDDIVEHAHDLMVENGVMVISETMPDWSVVETEQKTRSGARYSRWQGRIQTTFYNVDDPKDFVVSSAPAFGLDQGDKGPGKAHTYGAKANLIKTLFLVTGDESEELRAESAQKEDTETVVSIGKERLKNFCESISVAKDAAGVKAAGRLAIDFIKANGDNKDDAKIVYEAGSKRLGVLKTAAKGAK